MSFFKSSAYLSAFCVRQEVIDVQMKYVLDNPAVGTYAPTQDLEDY